MFDCDTLRIYPNSSSKLFDLVLYAQPTNAEHFLGRAWGLSTCKFTLELQTYFKVLPFAFWFLKRVRSIHMTFATHNKQCCIHFDSVYPFILFIIKALIALLHTRTLLPNIT